MLDRARRGCYPASSLKDMPPPWRHAAFSRRGDEFCVKDEFRREQPPAPFSLILCRHLAVTVYRRRRR